MPFLDPSTATAVRGGIAGALAHDVITRLAKLRSLFVKEIAARGLPWGLWFEDVEGGNTTTARDGPQAFQVVPKLVYKVFADGRPDEAVRGVNIVGTPLASFTKILAAGADAGVFNGVCGAESGWVPVSAAAPTLLISELEVEKQEKDAARPPLLPAPHHHERGLLP